MTTKTQNLKHKFNRYYKDGGNADSAFLICHGSYDNKGFTALTSPGTIHFYTFHGHALYTVEIFQVIDYQARVRLDDEIINCKPKVATSIMGSGQPCWNYWLCAWPEQETANFLSLWRKGGHAADTDLFMLTAGVGGILSDPPNARMNDFFAALNDANLSYDVIHFLCCRSQKGGDAGKRLDPGSTAPLYKQSNPYWKK